MANPEEKFEKLNAKYSRLQEKAQKQRSEIVRLTRKMEALTSDKQALLVDIKWMRGER
jgi:predicted nuclease with TOPRIM domain|tara:strand:+ start:418 stop:591 length:174 start_codon:yes stop_codon:yes gene_type:complete